ncbi:MAG: DUF423 domain-containing protein [Alicyclobacillus sp.]|nr:DUF423 domain-containing protein [Alicyclobacillus sp.]
MAFLIVGGVLGFLAVALGAFAAHGLRAKVPPDRLATFHTGAQYQMYHALALIACGISMRLWPPGAWFGAAGWLFTVGVILFAGSLYLLCVSGKRWLGAITPVGGLCFLAGWVCFVIACLQA